MLFVFPRMALPQDILLNLTSYLKLTPDFLNCGPETIYSFNSSSYEHQASQFSPVSFKNNPEVRNSVTGTIEPVIIVKYNSTEQNLNDLYL